MDEWAASYGSRVAFVCVSCAGPQLAGQFGSQLKLKHCHNTWVDEDDMPTWGQLGCNGFIVLDGSHSVVCRASPAYLEVRDAAFRHVEKLLDALVASKPAPQLQLGRVDPAVGGACAEVRFGAAAAEEEEEDADTHKAKAPKSEQPLASAATAIKVPSVKVEVLDAEHERCEAALARLAARKDATALTELLAVYEDHFAHEEALLDQHLYASVVEKQAKAAGGGGGFNADEGARTSHFADHAAMLAALHKHLDEFARRARIARELGLDENIGAELTDAEVAKLASDFERHATSYDGGYADRLSAAMAASSAAVSAA